MALSPKGAILTSCALTIVGFAYRSEKQLMHMMTLEELSFEAYKTHYGRDYADDSDEHKMREALFWDRIEALKAHNEGPSSWKMGVNHFTDRTHEELDMLNGHRPLGHRGGASLLEVASGEATCGAQDEACNDSGSSCCSGLLCGLNGKCSAPIKAESIDWTNMTTAKRVWDQGACGSCWAVAAVGVLNVLAEIQTKGRFTRNLSPQSIVDCSPNADECGGQGGCKGSTTELAYEWMKSSDGGVTTVDVQPYTARDGTCTARQMKQKGGLVTVTGWRKLKENDGQEMLDALATVGPLAATIAAGSLHAYAGGVFDKCDDVVLNHAVALMGYGFDKSTNLHYWNIRNSWGRFWGERGYFKLRRAAPNQKESCAWDNKPADGVACKDRKTHEYPKKQWVCGQCGFLFDTAYPVGIVIPDAMLDAPNSEKKEDSSDLASKAAVSKNEECKGVCQRFDMKHLTGLFQGKDFGTDVNTCVQMCDKHFPSK
eukprot:TRINITY_DN3517_c0_g1_i2.p1 TRINITY_DN3517_c0_g1~~TRINITY_DN3517_c0_g1_i2.p1  ORF type:complete len:515 (+),score=83.77 TRINITY_DN3517_c0_g1_i2:91-1545(+)